MNLLWLYLRIECFKFRMRLKALHMAWLAYRINVRMNRIERRSRQIRESLNLIKERALALKALTETAKSELNL